MTLIVETDALAAFCARQAKAEFLAVDTEFMRDSTYWPKLCLVQIGTPDEAVGIDPLGHGCGIHAKRRPRKRWRATRRRPVKKNLDKQDR